MLGPSETPGRNRRRVRNTRWPLEDLSQAARRPLTGRDAAAAIAADAADRKRLAPLMRSSLAPFCRSQPGQRHTTTARHLRAAESLGRRAARSAALVCRRRPIICACPMVDRHPTFWTWWTVDLRPPISGALQRAMKEGVSIAYGGIVRRARSDEERVKVCVRPLAIRSTGRNLLSDLLGARGPPPGSVRRF